MSERPTREQVDSALVAHDELLELHKTAACCILAAEVRALRGEVRHMQCDIEQGNTVCEQHTAMLATVSILPEQWRELAMRCNDNSSPTLLVDCAEELEAALRGER